MDREALKEALARHPAGVVVVSTRVADGYRGLTVTSFASVSLDPPMVLVCLDRLAQSRDAILEAGAFNVSALRRDQEFIADRFAGRAPLAGPRWREIPHRLGLNGIPIVEGCVAWLECRLEQVHEAGDHDVALGSVEAGGTGPGDPLVYWDRGFWRLQ